MRTSFRFALTFLACGMAASCLPATAQVLDATLPMQYIPLEIPCRAADTRASGGAITAGTVRNFSPGGGGCSISAPTSGVIAYAMNITVVPHGPLNYLTVWPAGELQPQVSTLNSPDGRIKANAAIVTGGTNGQISVFASSTTDVLLDVSGYFVAEVPVPPTYTYFPITPCRVVDTRVNNGTSFGAPSLVAGQQRTFAVVPEQLQSSRSAGGSGRGLFRKRYCHSQGRQARRLRNRLGNLSEPTGYTDHFDGERADRGNDSERGDHHGESCDRRRPLRYLRAMKPICSLM